MPGQDHAPIPTRGDGEETIVGSGVDQHLFGVRHGEGNLNQGQILLFVSYLLSQQFMIRIKF